MDKYFYHLPDALIAQQPASPRDSARLLVYNTQNGQITDSVFSKLGDFLPESTSLVLNNSKVENCRYIFENDEIFVIEKNDPKTIRAMVRPGKKFKLGATYQPNDWLKIEVINIDPEGIRTLKLNISHDDSRLKKYEHIPLPPYIKQNDSLASEYQTVYAKPPGSLAAPTAGLHFTKQLLDNLASKHEIIEITLHVGLGTFAKLTDENIKTGKLHEEHFSLDKKNADKLNSATSITAVGTTSARTLESLIMNDLYKAGLGLTDIFITPGYKFKSVDSLITNFHLPSTSLMMMVAALIADKRHLYEDSAIEELIRVYKHAVNNNYRFYSFGDAMLVV